MCTPIYKPGPNFSLNLWMLHEQLEPFPGKVINNFHSESYIKYQCSAVGLFYNSPLIIKTLTVSCFLKAMCDKPIFKEES